MAACTNPWLQVYKLAAGQTCDNSIITTLRKPDGSDIELTRHNERNAHLFTEDTEEDTLHHKNIRRTIEESIRTGNDLEFSGEEIKHTIENFNDKKSTWYRWDHRWNLSTNI